MNLPRLFVIISVFLLAVGNEYLVAQESPPTSVPDYTPAPPPTLAEIPPFPSNTDNQVAMVASHYDPQDQSLIISVDSQSNQQFVLQRSTDLISWDEEIETKLGNKTIITFRVALDPEAANAFYRVIKR